MLYIVSTPIGNPEDITLRALRVLREANAVVCEELRMGARLLHYHRIDNTILDLNEHTERERVPELLGRLGRGETLALISDHGTPLLADPGSRLVDRAIANGFPVTAVPGPSSLLAALVVSALPLERFRFVGMLPPKKELRQQALSHLKDEQETWVVFDAPYRLAPLLVDLQAALGPDRHVVIACDLTTPNEQVIRGRLDQVRKHFNHPFRGEFVVIVSGQAGRRPNRHHSAQARRSKKVVPFNIRQE